MSSQTSEPRRLPGHRPRELSPTEFYELTATRPLAADVLGDDFGMATHELDAIRPEGIELKGQTFVSPEMDTVVSKRTDGRRFLVRYDPVALARGALERVRVYEVDPHGALHFRLEMVDTECAGDLMSVERVAALRRQYEKRLIAKRGRAERELAAMRRGNRALDRLLADREAQARNRGASRSEPKPAAPMVGPSSPAQGSSPGSADLMRRSQDRSSTASAGSDVRDRATAVGDETPPSKRRPSTHELLTGKTRVEQEEIE